MGRFFKTAATLSETKDFLSFLKSRGIELLRSGEHNSPAYFDTEKNIITIKRKSSEPINNLFHEGGHALIQQTPLKIKDSVEQLIKFTPDVQLLHERLANSRAIDFLKNEKSKIDFLNNANKNYSTYKYNYVMNKMNAEKQNKIKSIVGSISTSPSVTTEYAPSTFDSLKAVYKNIKRNPEILNEIKKVSGKYKDLLKLKANEV